MYRRQSYAPFGSVSIRVRKSKTTSEQPGPGAYEVSLPLINPIVKTFRKQNNNVIVKLGHIGTVAFQSDDTRFKSEGLVSIGPGQYSPQRVKPLKEWKKPQQRMVAVDRVRQLIKNQPERRAAIEEIRQISINDYVQIPFQNSKARLKDDLKYPLSKPKGSIWSKLTEKRGKQIKMRSVSEVGPCNYDPKDHQSHGDLASSAFKSESIRSFFDQIYFETNQEKLAKERQLNKYKVQGLGPGNYNLSLQKSKFHKYQFFGSTQERKLL